MISQVSDMSNEITVVVSGPDSDITVITQETASDVYIQVQIPAAIDNISIVA